MYVKRMPKNLWERKIVASDNRTTYGLKLYKKDYPGAVWGFTKNTSPTH